jgi:hypothetical protein
MSEQPPLAFYTVTGRDFFPGAVALLNSLRLHGHDEPLFVLDCGMEPDQRERLAEHATILAGEGDRPPSLQKLIAPLAHPAEVMVLLDADLIVTRPLTPLIDLARRTGLVGFENETPRFFPQWERLLRLGGLRRGPYLSSSALFVHRRIALEALRVAEGRQGSLERNQTWLGNGEREDPLFFADQDIINAAILSLLAAEQVVALDRRLEAQPPFDGLRLLEPERLRCGYRDGTEPYLVHHYFRKPWLSRMRSNVYSRLLTRLLCEPDVALRPDPDALPLRLRRGPSAAIARTAVDLGIGAPAAMRRRLRRRPERIAAWPDGRSSSGTRR